MSCIFWDLSERANWSSNAPFWTFPQRPYSPGQAPRCRRTTSRYSIGHVKFNRALSSWMSWKIRRQRQAFCPFFNWKPNLPNYNPATSHLRKLNLTLSLVHEKFNSLWKLESRLQRALARQRQRKAAIWAFHANSLSICSIPACSKWGELSAKMENEEE